MRRCQASVPKRIEAVKAFLSPSATLLSHRSSQASSCSVISEGIWNIFLSVIWKLPAVWGRDGMLFTKRPAEHGAWWSSPKILDKLGRLPPLTSLGKSWEQTESHWTSATSGHVIGHSLSACAEKCPTVQFSDSRRRSGIICSRTFSLQKSCFGASVARIHSAETSIGQHVTHSQAVPVFFVHLFPPPLCQQNPRKHIVI